MEYDDSKLVRLAIDSLGNIKPKVSWCFLILIRCIVCSGEMAGVSQMILKLEQQQVGIRPPSRHPPLHPKLGRSVSQPANGPQAAGAYRDAREPASRRPETEANRKSVSWNVLARERSTHARTDVSDGVRITSPQRIAAFKPKKVRLSDALLS